MRTMRKIVVGDTTEAVIKLAFDKRAAQESGDSPLDSMSRTLKIRDLRIQIISFIKRNPNSRFRLEIPEFNTEKLLRIGFSNFVETNEDDDSIAKYELKVNDRFTECTVIQKAEYGKDIIIPLM